MKDGRPDQPGWDSRVIDYCDNEMTPADRLQFEKELETNVILAEQVEAYRKFTWALRNKDNKVLLEGLRRIEDTKRKSTKRPGRDRNK